MFVDTTGLYRHVYGLIRSKASVVGEIVICIRQSRYGAIGMEPMIGLVSGIDPR